MCCRRRSIEHPKEASRFDWEAAGFSFDRLYSIFEVTNIRQPERTALGDIFDRTIRSMSGLPDVINTKATTVRSLSSVLELSQTFIVQTYRQRDEGDTIFIEYIGVEGSLRFAPPPVVSDVIARQRDTISGKSRSKAAKANAMDRKARGIEPGFKKRRPA